MAGALVKGDGRLVPGVRAGANVGGHVSRGDGVGSESSTGCCCPGCGVGSKTQKMGNKAGRGDGAESDGAGHDDDDGIAEAAAVKFTGDGVGTKKTLRPSVFCFFQRQQEKQTQAKSK